MFGTYSEKVENFIKKQIIEDKVYEPEEWARFMVSQGIRLWSDPMLPEFFYIGNPDDHYLVSQKQKIKVRFRFKINENDTTISFIPFLHSGVGDNHTCGILPSKKAGEKLKQEILAAFGLKTITLEFPEPLIKLPVPSWLSISIDSGLEHRVEDYINGIQSTLMFVSEAKEELHQYLETLKDIEKKLNTV